MSEASWQPPSGPLHTADWEESGGGAKEGCSTWLQRGETQRASRYLGIMRRPAEPLG